MSSVFICHSPGDARAAALLVERLKKAGHTVLSQEHGLRDVAAQIDTSDIFLLLISRHCVKPALRNRYRLLVQLPFHERSIHFDCCDPFHDSGAIREWRSFLDALWSFAPLFPGTWQLRAGGLAFLFRLRSHIRRHAVGTIKNDPLPFVHSQSKDPRKATPYRV
jgi:hypothetical protein